MEYKDREKRSNREKVVRHGAEITGRLKAINNLQKRTDNKKLFDSQRDKLRKELLELKKEL